MQIEIKEMKSTKWNEGFIVQAYGRLDTAEERISEVEDRVTEMTQMDISRRKKNFSNVWDLWNNIKYFNSHIIVTYKERREILRQKLSIHMVPSPSGLPWPSFLKQAPIPDPVTLIHIARF